MELADRAEVRSINETLRAEGKQPARFIEILLGITKASLTTDSFLSASSFQHTIKVLANAAIAADKDPLYGLKENVIIGKLIPAGTGFSDKRVIEMAEIAGEIQSSSEETLDVKAATTSEEIEAVSE